LVTRNDSWNDTAVDFPAKRDSLHRLFEEQAARTPDVPAVAFEGRSLSYADLDHRAEQLARQLRMLGVEQDAPVGLFMERSVELVVGILAVLKAGAAYMPIDATAPAQRISYLLTDARVRVLITQGSLNTLLPQLDNVTVIDLDTFDWASSRGPARNANAFDRSHVAYVIYTSGSTGQPKGVCVEHRNIVNYVLGVSARLRFEPGMQHALISTAAADLGNTVLFPALVTGGCLHLISKERAESQAALSEYFTREKIDVMKIVPSHLAALQTGRDPQRVMPRKRLILGGEASRLDWIETLRAMAPGCEIFNHYGPTETTVGVLTYQVDGKPAKTESNTLCIGKPLPNSRVYVLDESGNPTEPGVQGEICIGGAGVARGYLHRAELAAEKFVDDPFMPGGRMYRTGDRARRLPDGNIEFCGRVDHQVKVHGYRVELGEIEGALLSHSGLREAVVTALDDASGEKQLAAYVVPKHEDPPASEAPLTPVTLRKHLKDLLPTYMVPSVIVVLEKIPLTANGKIDRQGLARVDVTQLTAAALANLTRPQTETQKVIADIWSRLLGKPADSFGIADDFFDLGGDSLRVIRGVARIRDACGVDVQTDLLFENTTIASLASAIDELKAKSVAAGEPASSQKGSIVRQARRPTGR
jgi:amino acid adenylation domain-containing protein